MRSDLVPLIVAAAFAAACATAPPPPPADDPTAQAEAVPPPASHPHHGPAQPPPTPPPPSDAAASTLCWETEEEITLSAGGEQPGARRVVRMRFEPATGRVVVDTLRFDPEPRVPPRLSTTTWTVAEGGGFTLRDAASRVGGSGTLLGEPWSWSGWTSDSRLDSGIRIRERATIGADGALTLEREVFGPDGQAVMTLAEEGRPLAPAECEARMAEPSATP